MQKCYRHTALKLTWEAEQTNSRCRKRATKELGERLPSFFLFDEKNIFSGIRGVGAILLILNSFFSALKPLLFLCFLKMG
jgi:hypothetical protein